MATHNDFGREGERIAADYFIREGYEVLDENWVAGKAEIDLIILKAGMLIFVEVKTRSSAAFGNPDEFVGAHKREQLAAAARAYIEIMDYQGEVRFDVVAILFNEGAMHSFNHIEDAFWPD